MEPQALTSGGRPASKASPRKAGYSTTGNAPIGEFYFIPARTAAAPPKPAGTEMLFRQSIKDSKDVDAFTAYLKRYPDDAFADIARNRLRKAKGNRDAD